MSKEYKSSAEQETKVEKGFTVRGYPSGSYIIEFSPESDVKITDEEKEKMGWNEVIPRPRWDNYVILVTGAGEYALEKKGSDLNDYQEAVNSDIFSKDGAVVVTGNKGLISISEFKKYKPEDWGELGGTEFIYRPDIYIQEGGK